MAISNHERIGRALKYLKEGLYPFIERDLIAPIYPQVVLTPTVPLPKP